MLLVNRGGQQQIAGEPTTTPATSDVAGPPATSATTAPADPAAGATLVDSGGFGGAYPNFQTPSGNIACLMSAEETRCDVLERTWQVPPAPADCVLAYGTGATVAGTGSGELACASDTVAAQGLAVLNYGEALDAGGVVCVSQQTGVRCTNRATGHGFQVARASYQLF